MRYLITGGTSFIGKALVRLLRNDGHEIIRLRCDVRDAPAVSRAAYGCDSILHLAYARPLAPDVRIFDVAVRGMASVLNACEEQNVRELMLVTSPLAADVRQGEGNAYGAGKLICEMMAEVWSKSYILDRLIIARPFNVYGPSGGYYHVIPQFITRMRDLIREGVPDPLPFPINGTGNEIRSFVYIDDCVDQLCALLSDISPPGLSMRDVGTSDEQTIAEVACKVASCFGRKIEIMTSPLPASAPIHRVPIAGGVLPPKVSFADGLEKTVAWYQAQER